MTSRTLISDFKTSGISMLKSTSLSKLQSLVDDCNAMYYNDEHSSLLTDNEFDVLKEYVDRHSAGVDKSVIGAPIAASSAHRKVELPYLMASMDKIKPDTNALSAWKRKYKNSGGHNVVSVKLDGVSGLFSTEGGVAKLYTRGNGRVGQDISHIIKHIPALMGVVENCDSEITMRGEFIIAKDAFDVLCENADEGERMSNPRNFVSGVINSKHSKYYSNIDFVAYELIRVKSKKSERLDIKPSEQFRILNELGIPVVDWIAVTDKMLTNDMLSGRLVRMRKEYKYEIDGLIVADDAVHQREWDEVKNPDHAFAFKMVLSEQMAEAKVLAVLWSASKDGYLKPKIQIEPVTIGGATIEYATAFNAAFIVEKKIGVGALIKIIRSGDVIPTIMDVVEPADVVMLPDGKGTEWVWNSTKIDIVLKNPEENEEVVLKRIEHFFSGIGAMGLGRGHLKRIIDEGFDSIPDIINMDLEDLIEIDGFQETLSKKIIKNIHSALRETSVAKLMSVSNIFGRGMGEKKLELLIEEYPTVLLDDGRTGEKSNEKIRRIGNIKGFSLKSAERLVMCIDQFIEFTKECGLYKKKILADVAKAGSSGAGSSGAGSSGAGSSGAESHPLYKKNIVFTGFRDKAFELALTGPDVGAKIGTTISKTVFVVIVKDKVAMTTNSSKINKARELGIPIIDIATFKKRYLN
jgi:DNA ligase (NAD+)